ncbi:MAG: adenine phosphoribosyltransferase [Pseudomonadota bacterium]
MDIKNYIRDIQDFPKAGIVFKDISPILKSPEAFNETINIFEKRYKDQAISYIAGIEARGFIFGAALALRLGLGFIPIRKPGKLPYKTISQTYELEYGTDTVEMHVDAINEGDNVLIIDDLLATGGTAEACAKLIKKAGGKVHECAFVIELAFLKGKEKLKDDNVYSIMSY